MAKALARAGIASRREVERLIGLGRVAVNGRILATPAVLVKRDDVLTVDGKVVNAPEPTRLWRYHKPAGLMTTHRDPGGRPTVFEALPKGLPRVISVGRLDLNSEGLLLLTNDGALARALELPSSGWRRVYRARALGRVTQARLDVLKDGITVEGVHYGPIEAKLDKAEEKADGRANLWLTVSLNEGKNREVRRVLEALGLKVNRLIRLAYGPFQLGVLGDGEVEEIGPRVIREQLAEHIAPEMMPQGDTIAAPPPQPARRPGASKRQKTSNALADPRRKPSKVRAQAERKEAERAEAERNRPPRREDRPGKPFRKDGDRPRKSYGDRPDRPRREGEGFKPRYGSGPRKPRKGDERREGGRPPRREGGEGFKPRYGSGPRKPREGDERREGGEGFKPRYGSGPRKPREGDERREGGRPPRRGGGEGFKPRYASGPRKPREGDERREDGRGPRREGGEGFKPRYGSGPRKPREGDERRDSERPQRREGGGGFKGKSADFKPRGPGGPRGGKPGGKPGARPFGSGPRKPGGPRKPRP